MVCRRHGDRGRRCDGDRRGDLRGRAHSEQSLQRRGERACVEAVTCALAPLGGLDLQTGCKRAPRAKDQRLDSRLRHVELSGDLAVRQSLPLAEQDRAALRLGHRLQGVLQPDELVAALLTRRYDLLQHLEVVRRLDPPAPTRRPPPRQTDVVRDLEEPCGFDLRHDPATQRAECVHERRLNGVLSLFARAEVMQAIAEDLPGEAFVEVARRVRLGCGRLLDACGAAC